MCRKRVMLGNWIDQINKSLAVCRKKTGAKPGKDGTLATRVFRSTQLSQVPPGKVPPELDLANLTSHAFWWKRVCIKRVIYQGVRENRMTAPRGEKPREK